MTVLHRDKHDGQGWWHWCPGCEELHRLPEGWEFNGDPERPTFTPSFKHTWRGARNANGNVTEQVCHYILTDGVLNYCGDCTHPLVNQQVSLPAIPAGEVEKWGL